MMDHSIHSLRRRWRHKTRGQVLDGATFRHLRVERGWFVLGVMGSVGPWRDPADEADARAALDARLAEASAAHGPRLAVASGATDAGVLSVVYGLCAARRITAIGVTCEAGLALPVAALDWLVPVGQRFGDESALFVDVCDAFVVLGGGEQARREAIGGGAQGKPVTLIQGFGGAADDLAEAGLPGFEVVPRA